MALPLPTELYAVLGMPPSASAAELKAAYRTLAKRHHPDVGGDAKRILALNAAWAVLGDREKRRRYDAERGRVAGQGAAVVRPARARARRDSEISAWLRQVYGPIDRLLAQVINPFPAQLRALSADPYDNDLMATFCDFLETSQQKLEKVVALYRSMACPGVAADVGLSLYHCFSQVQDALAEFERYTLGYVDNYLHDGREMLREARQLRSQLLQDRKHLEG
ncbi:J domain-containing protein [Synechococcus sp. CS-602]|uniref:J domain-containing protein n=1 Tax=Synechococcus sp. CS-602 TaxID=2847982 RepID=UPI00223A96DE|nr:J domain-containing protein [Synechococcus sp. CS-602]MCT0205606.1 J domain-containing protein [Synechococcus sp. CS-602]MCT4364139.1 J domain-containing protein [Candidatus Regnicoccus frigidus MAG-AL1]